ncbi:MAG: autoinducer binding domain-containing protein [Pseudomonadota bacterium]
MEALTQLPSSSSKFGYFADHLNAHGFSDVFYARLLPGASDPILMRRWNPDWAEIYDTKRYAMWDSALSLGQRSEVPFRLRMPIVAQSEKQAEFYREAEAYNRLNGFAAPFRSATAGMAGFSATGLDQEPSDGLMLAAVATGYVFNLTMIGQMASEQCKRMGITPRQLMFLRLLGEGHTHVEIAELLGVTEDWAHKSFSKLREKFEVRTDPALMKKVVEAGLLT